MRFRIVMWAAAAVLAACSLQGQPAKAPDSGVVIRTESKLVLVDTIVTDKKGNIVRDLEAKDFRVSEDGKEQPITSFSFEADPASPAFSEKRYTILFFDASSMNIGNMAVARTAVLKFLDSDAARNHRVAVVSYSGVFRIVQNFTEDFERVKKALDKVGPFSVTAQEPQAPGRGGSRQQGLPGRMVGGGDSNGRNLVITVGDFARALNAVNGRKALVLFSGGVFLPADQLTRVTTASENATRSNVAIYPVEIRELTSPPIAQSAPAPVQVAGISRAALLNMPVAFSLNVTPAVAFFQRGGGGAGGGGTGGGAPGGGAPGGGGAAGGGSRGGGGTPGGPGAGGPGTTGPSTGPGQFPSSNPNTGNPGNRNGSFGHPDSQNPTFDNSNTLSDVLYKLADETGGFVTRYNENADEALQKIGHEQNEHYLLGYVPPDSDEGSCHRLKVKLLRGGLKERSRTDYCKVKSRDVLSGKPVEKVLESRAAGSQPGSVTAAMQAPFFYTSANVARVNLAIDIATDTVKVEKQKGKLGATIDVLGVAYRPDNTVAARFSDSVKLEFGNKKEAEAFKKRPLRYENEFDIASGEYSLKIAFNTSGENFGKVELPLKVDPYDPKDFRVSGLALSKEARSASALGLTLGATLPGEHTPLVSGDVELVPAGSSLFRKGDNAAFYFEVYEPLLQAADAQSSTAVGVQIRIVDRKTGEQKLDTGLMRLDLSKMQTPPVIPVADRLPIDKLTAGSYELELNAMDSANQKFKRTADFEVE